MKTPLALRATSPKRGGNHLTFSEFKPPLGGLGVKNREKKEVWGIKTKRERINPV
jgi:hypothetical protein